jgi:hypothetical protein
VRQAVVQDGVLREEAVVEDQAMVAVVMSNEQNQSFVHSLPQDANCSDQG